jgi:hypothetical protein
MKLRSILAAAIMLALAAGSMSGALAQPARLKDAILGDWALVSLRATRADGSAGVPPYGPRAIGNALFERNGRFAVVLISPDIPKYASSDREKPTPAEAAAAAIGSYAIIGSYTVNGADRTVILHVDASSYPNDNGTAQTRVVKFISETGLVLVNPTSPNGGAAMELAFKKIE